MTYPTNEFDCDPSRLADAYQKCLSEMWRRQNTQGFWEGRLSSSALSTATAVSALALTSQHGSGASGDRQLIENGLGWLRRHQNEDGGFGDTSTSDSNLSTTLLVLAACQLSGMDANGVRPAAEEYVQRCGGPLAVRQRYGRDKTFAIPILANCALAGICDWKHVSPLPFELACLPQEWYRFVQLPVVSYAIPALVAVGQLIHHHRTGWNPWRWVRDASIQPSLKVLQRMQPASGGFLEAIPLTSFVAMSLAACGHAAHSVVQDGLRFLRDTVREDGSWPIDTNLATWNTSLAVMALRHSLKNDPVATGHKLRPTLSWLLDCQHVQRHPFTGAEPGGWGWTSLSGAVPDADDTPAAMLALKLLVPSASEDGRAEIQRAGRDGANWLLGLQNRDGGWPTFCRGWGKLPFDRSGTDLTAHALRALNQCRDFVDPSNLSRAMQRGWDYLASHQNADGSWTPLWFGNQAHPSEENPIYGTSKVLLAYADMPGAGGEAWLAGLNWIVGTQNLDGSWGARPLGQPAGGTVEESALAVEALLRLRRAFPENTAQTALSDAAGRGLTWLIEAVEGGQYLNGSPIGLYFAKLWYDETMYPLNFVVSALGEALEWPPGNGFPEANAPTFIREGN